MISQPAELLSANHIFIGTAGWTVPRASRDRFPDQGSHLERHAARLNAVEINSSFYRPHRPATYQRWASSVPEAFRFSVKLPKLITHTKRFVDVRDDLAKFLSQATSLGSKLGPILIQLPPSFAFDEMLARSFLDALRLLYMGTVTFEPRHTSWFTSDVDDMLCDYRIARVRADPAPVPEAARPGGWPGLRYHRLHGSPRIYYSPYDSDFLAGVAADLVTETAERWCVFDNTALGYAAADALALAEKVARALSR